MENPTAGQTFLGLAETGIGAILVTITVLIGLYIVWYAWFKPAYHGGKHYKGSRVNETRGGTQQATAQAGTTATPPAGGVAENPKEPKKPNQTSSGKPGKTTSVIWGTLSWIAGIGLGLWLFTSWIVPNQSKLKLPTLVKSSGTVSAPPRAYLPYMKPEETKFPMVKYSVNAVDSIDIALYTRNVLPADAKIFELRQGWVNRDGKLEMEPINSHEYSPYRIDFFESDRGKVVHFRCLDWNENQERWVFIKGADFDYVIGQPSLKGGTIVSGTKALVAYSDNNYMLHLGFKRQNAH